MNTEEWKDIPGFEGYQASNIGRIRAKQRISWNGKVFATRKERLLTPQQLPDGYWQVPLTLPGEKQRRFLVHRLVAYTFTPNVNSKPFVNHKDGNKSNNVADNLEWVTRSENAKHAFALGLQSNKGESHPGHKLTEEDVTEIRNRYSNGESSYKIFNSGSFPISYTNIKDIIARRIWTHV